MKSRMKQTNITTENTENTEVIQGNFQCLLWLHKDEV